LAAWRIAVSSAVTRIRRPVLCCLPLAVPEAGVHRFNHVFQGQPVDQVELRGITHLGIDDPVRSEIHHAFTGDPVQSVDRLHDGQCLAERLEIALERPRVGAVPEPGAERIGFLSRKTLVANGLGELNDRLGAQSAVEVIMQQRLRGAAQDVVGEHSALAVDGVGTKCREADGDVLGTISSGGVANPLASAREYRLTGVGDRGPVLVIDDHRTFEDQRDLVELRCLERLVPVGGGDHVGDRHGLAAGVDPANVLADDLAARDRDARGFTDESRHAFTLAAGPGQAVGTRSFS